MFKNTNCTLQLLCVFVGVFAYRINIHFQCCSYRFFYVESSLGMSERESAVRAFRHFPASASPQKCIGRSQMTSHFSLISTHAHTDTASLSMQMRSSVAVGKMPGTSALHKLFFIPHHPHRPQINCSMLERKARMQG